MARLMSNPPIVRFVMLISALAGAVAIVIGCFIWNDSQPPSAQVEVFKFLLQILTVGAVGASVSMLSSEYTRQRAVQDAKLAEDRQSERDIAQLKRDLRSRLMDVYMATKRIRRLLHADPIADPSGNLESARLPRSVYNRYLRKLNALQFQIEIVRREIKVNEEDYTQAKHIRSAASDMEGFLRDIIEEFEVALPLYPPEGWSLEKLPKLYGLADYSPTSAFEQQFVAAFHTVLDALQADIAGKETLDKVVSHADKSALPTSNHRPLAPSPPAGQDASAGSPGSTARPPRA